MGHVGQNSGIVNPDDDSAQASPAPSDTSAVPSKPDVLPVLPEHIPQTLKNRPNWVCWRLTWNGRKWTKVPFQPNGRHAASNKPATWSSFDAVLRAYNTGDFDGIGIVLDGKPDANGLVLAGVDFDDVLEGGKLDGQASARIRHLGSYWEKSPSGTGIRVFCLAKPLASGIMAGGTELYTSARYLTVTGHGTGEVTEAVDSFAALAAELKPQTTSSPRFDATVGAIAGKMASAFAGMQSGSNEFGSGITDGGDRLDLAGLRSAVLALPVDKEVGGIRPLCDEGQWRDVAMALAAAAADHPGDEETLYTILDEASNRPGAGDYDSDENWKRFEGYKRGTLARRAKGEAVQTIASIFHMARRVGWQPLQPQQETAADSGAFPQSPHPQPLPRRLHPVPPFDLGLLPPVVARFCADIAAGVSAPVEYPIVNLLAIAGGVVGNKLLLSLKTADTWFEAANLWGLVVGGVSAAKTPSAARALSLLQRLETREAAKHEVEMSLWRGAKLAHAAIVRNAEQQATAAVKKGQQPQPVSIPVDPPEPKRRRFLTHDATYEKLGELCAASPTGAVVYGDELSGLLSDLDREEKRAARAFYLAGYNGTSATSFDRIGRGTILLPRFALTVLGNIQPDPLLRYIVGSTEAGRQNDGLAQRFQMLVWPDPVARRYTDTAPDQKAIDTMRAVFDALADLDPLKAGAKTINGSWEAYIELEPAARARFIDWHDNVLIPKAEDPDLSDTTRAHLMKMPKLVAGLALLFHLIVSVKPVKRAPPDMPQGIIPILSDVPMLQLERAIGVATIFEAHAMRAYGAAHDRGAAAAKALARQITKGKLSGEVKARTVVQKGWSGLTAVDAVEAGFEVLADYGWTAEVPQPRGAAGRPLARVWKINPLGLGAAVEAG